MRPVYLSPTNTASCHQKIWPHALNITAFHDIALFYHQSIKLSVANCTGHEETSQRTIKSVSLCKSDKSLLQKIRKYSPLIGKMHLEFYRIKIRGQKSKKRVVIFRIREKFTSKNQSHSQRMMHLMDNWQRRQVLSFLAF